MANNLGKMLNFKNNAKHKIAVMCICVLFVSSMFFVSFKTAAASSITPALHTVGHYIVDTNNNVVYLRGIGRAGDTDSMSGIWSGPGDNVFDYSYKWRTDTAVLAQKMDQTFQSYRDVWKVNMIRLFIPVDWWWQDTINPFLAYGQGPNQIMSYRNYMEQIVQEADKYGIYVDFVPYSVLNYYSGGGTWDGIPGSLGSASLNYIHTINQDETQAWRMWWTSVVGRLGSYSNLIFEMWNEPENAKQPYYDYMIDMYKIIRGLGNSNLIFMQWNMGLIPTYHELDWVPELHNQLKTAIGQEPQNVAYTTHPYRRAPYPNLQWATTYDGVKAQLNSPNMIPITRRNGIDVPIVFNEMGVMLDPSVYADNYYRRAQSSERTLSVDQRMQNELDFFAAILKNAQELDVGVCPFFWMQTGVWQGWEALLLSPTWDASATSPTPSQPGQLFIDSYVSQTPQPPPTPSPTPTPVPLPNGVLFEDGFEQAFSRWASVGGSGTHSETTETSYPHHGSYDAKFSAGFSSESYSSSPISSSPIVYFRQLIRIDTLPKSGQKLYLGSIQRDTAQNTVDAYIENRNGKIFWGVYTAINGVIYNDREATASNPKAGTYYEVEICRDATNGYSKLWVDGSLKISAQRANVGNADLIFSGVSYATSNAVVYVDCVKASTSFINPEAITPPTLTPTVSPIP